MDIKTLDKVSEFLKNATPDEENEHYHYEADRVANEARNRIGASNE